MGKSDNVNPAYVTIVIHGYIAAPTIPAPLHTTTVTTPVGSREQRIVFPAERGLYDIAVPSWAMTPSSTVEVKLWGGAGAGGYASYSPTAGSYGGAGGFTHAYVPVNGHTALGIIAGTGSHNSNGGFPNGGWGRRNGIYTGFAGGGGRSEAFWIDEGIENAFAVAGGGGGGGDSYAYGFGGAGGGNQGGSAPYGGTGGSQVGAGYTIDYPYDQGYNGSAVRI